MNEPDGGSSVCGIGVAKAGARAGTLDEVGSKAFNLQRMAAAGLPVPQAFVLSTAWCLRHQRDPAA